MTAEAPHFKIRLPQALKFRLENSAAVAGRSLTAEIVRRLEESFDSLDSVMLRNRRRELEILNRDFEALLLKRSALVSEKAPTAALASTEAEIERLRARQRDIEHDIAELLKDDESREARSFKARAADAPGRSSRKKRP